MRSMRSLSNIAILTEPQGRPEVRARVVICYVAVMQLAE